MTHARREFRRPTLRSLRLWAGVIVGTYVTMHLLNHSLGLISIDAQEAARPWIMWVWWSWPGQIALYGSLAMHAGLGLYALGRRRVMKAPPWEWVQIILGVAIPYFLLVHIVNTRGTRILTQIDIDYVYEIANLWVKPNIRLFQTLLVVLVWGHFVAGLHFWLRVKSWYARTFPVILLAYALIPATAWLGFAHAGMGMTAKSLADPAWWKEISTRGTPKDPQNAKTRIWLRSNLPNLWLGIVGVVLVYGQGRNLIARRARIRVEYPDGNAVMAPIGLSILEVSRMIGYPHMSVCGGRARCTTCRVRVVAEGELPNPNADEIRALQRIEAPEGLRLACQLRPKCNVIVAPLLTPMLAHRREVVASQSTEFGTEMHVTVLFIDLRGSTRLAETKLPFDVVFLFNQFFEQMASAIEKAGGLYSNFTGDGLMALFGLKGSRQESARAALACASDMLHRLDALNVRYADELQMPIAMGIGIHTGEAIVGRMGPPKAPIITALGDTVNIAARLESATKEAKVPLIISRATLEEAGIRGLTYTPLNLRGRIAPLSVATLVEEDAFELFAHL